MINSNTSPKELRVRALARLGATRTEVGKMSTEEVQDLVYELQVHQAELDITIEELRETQVELANTRDRYVDLFEFAPVGYLILDTGHIIRHANAAAGDMLGIHPRNLAGKPLPIFAAEEDRDACHIHLRGVSADLYRTAELRFRRADGGLLWAKLHTARNGGDSPDSDRIRVALSDITQQKRLEETMIRRTRELEVTNKELEAFTYSVSHDLSTPLRIIQGFSEIVLEDYADKLDESGRYHLERIRCGADKMTQLLDDMLTLSRIARHELDRWELNFQEMAATIVDELRERSPTPETTIVIGPDVSINADIRLMRIALGNLIGNAWKFTRKTERPHIEIGALDRDNHTVYFVRDNGAGFDMKYADRLFAPFKRLHSNTEFAGSGIGLAIVQRVIHKHGGEIWAESEEGNGAAFYFTVG